MVVLIILDAMIYFGRDAAMTTVEELRNQGMEAAELLNTYIDSIAAPEFQHHDMYQLRIRRSRIEENEREYRRICFALKRMVIDEEEKKRLTEEFNALDGKIMNVLAKIDQRLADLVPVVVGAHPPAAAVAAAPPPPTIFPVTWGKFNGDDLQWDNFKQKFELGMHNLAGVSDGVKMQYLTDALTGRAADAMLGYKLEAANYVKLWEDLVKKYENKYIVVMKRLGKFYALPPIERRKATSRELEAMINGTNDLIRSAGGLGYDTNNWDLLLVYALQARLFPEDRSDWEAFRKADEHPKVDSMLDFLNLQMSRATNREQSQPDLRLQIEGGRRQQSSVGQPQAIGGTFVFGCGICGSHEHRAFECSEFTAASFPERKSMALAQKICFVCLKKGHFTNACSSSYRCKEQQCVAAGNTMHDRWLCPFKERQSVVATASYGHRTPLRSQSNFERGNDYGGRSGTKRLGEQS